MRTRHSRGPRHGNSLGLRLETLERRACPAAISIGDVSLAEGTTASPIARLTVRLSERSASAVAVNWATADGTALAGSDYRAASGTLVFSPGQTSKTIGVTVYADAVIEPDETFSVVLSAPIGATLANDTATVTIRNDEITQDAVPTISVSDTQLPERNVGRSDAVFTVSLSALTNVPVTVDYATVDGSATAADGDYAKTSSTLTFAPGETTKTVTVGVLGDSRTEQDESFGLVLSSPIGATLLKATGIATITNDDFKPLPPVVISVTGGSVVEGDGGTDAAAFATFTVSLSRVTDTPVTVSYKTADITAKVSDNDYVPVSGTLTFASGDKSKTVRVAIVGDTKRESDESFQLVLSSPTGATLNSYAGSAAIIDDDTPPSVSVNDVSVTEGNAGTTGVAFVITLSKPWKVPVTVTYATRDGTATIADSDYVPVSASVTIAAGETQATVTASVIGDTKAEIDETFSFVVLAATNADIGKGTGTATIRNDDSGEVVGFQITVVFEDPSLPDPTKQLFRSAAARWSQVITGDLPAVTYKGRLIDDFEFDVTVSTQMNPNQLGGANFYPDSLRPGAGGLPACGFGVFNATYMNQPGIFYTVLHEMGHALGFSPDLWQSSGFGLVAGWGNPGSSNPVFTGRNATREFNAIFGKSSASVPLDDVHGAGSYGAHWRESVFGTTAELMTWSWDPRSTRVDPLSRVTVGAMEDLGYTVNYAAADPYTPPKQSPGAAQRAAAGAAAGRPQSVPPRGFAWSIASASQSVSAALAFGSLVTPTAVTQPANGRSTRTVTASPAAARLPVAATESVGAAARPSQAAWSAFGS